MAAVTQAVLCPLTYSGKVGEGISECQPTCPAVPGFPSASPRPTAVTGRQYP